MNIAYLPEDLDESTSESEKTWRRGGHPFEEWRMRPFVTEKWSIRWYATSDISMRDLIGRYLSYSFHVIAITKSQGFERKRYSLWHGMNNGLPVILRPVILVSCRYRSRKEQMPNPESCDTPPQFLRSSQFCCFPRPLKVSELGLFGPSRSGSTIANAEFNRDWSLQLSLSQFSFIILTLFQILAEQNSLSTSDRSIQFPSSCQRLWKTYPNAPRSRALVGEHPLLFEKVEKFVYITILPKIPALGSTPCPKLPIRDLRWKRSTDPVFEGAPASFLPVELLGPNKHTIPWRSFRLIGKTCSDAQFDRDRQKPRTNPDSVYSGKHDFRVNPKSLSVILRYSHI
jgi:hypothetical protein